MRSDKQPHILVVGGGSIGQRHIKNLLELGAFVSLLEPDASRWPKSESPTIGIVGAHANIHLALHENRYTGAIVAVPTHLHAECALPLLRLGLPVLIEKPLAHTVEVAELLRPYAEQIRVGYSMRFHPAIQAIKEDLPEIGRVIYAHAEVGQYLPQWHPTEDYRQWYMAKREQGGGAILDLSHELDYLQWLVGPVSQADAFMGHIDNTLEITSDDVADIHGLLDDDKVSSLPVRFSCHMDLIDRSYNRRVRILGEQGTLDWDHNRGTVQVNGSAVTYGQDRNLQFVHEAGAFLKWLAGPEFNVPGRMATFEEAFHTLAVVEVLAQSGQFGT